MVGRIQKTYFDEFIKILLHSIQTGVSNFCFINSSSIKYYISLDIISIALKLLIVLLILSYNKVNNIIQIDAIQTSRYQNRYLIIIIFSTLSILPNRKMITLTIEFSTISIYMVEQSTAILRIAVHNFEVQPGYFPFD